MWSGGAIPTVSMPRKRASPFAFRQSSSDSACISRDGAKELVKALREEAAGKNSQNAGFAGVNTTMTDYAKKAWLAALGSKPGEVKELERRSEDRHMFTAAAEVVELSSGARFSTRTTDLGPGGCFIDTTNPFPVGAKVRVTVRKGNNEFHTAGNVVYSQRGLGMGIAFAELDAEKRSALCAWIGDPSGEAPTSSEAPRPEKWAGTRSAASSDRATLTRLVRLMITKGILTEAEGSSVLVDPVL